MKLFGLNKSVSKFSDLELLEKYKSEQNQFYVGELFKRYSELAYLVAIKYLKDRDAAKDAVMDVFEILLSKLLTQSITNFKSWFYVVIKNHCLIILRHKRDTLNIDEIENFENLFMENDSLLNLFDNDEIPIEIVTKMIDRLKEFQKKCITMFYLKRMSYKKIASVENQTEKNVKSCIQNGKRNLKIYLEEYINLNER